MRYTLYVMLCVVCLYAIYWVTTITSATANMHVRLKVIESQLREMKESKHGGETSIQP